MISSIEFFGIVPQTISLDNAKVAVKEDYYIRLYLMMNTLSELDLLILDELSSLSINKG